MVRDCVDKILRDVAQRVYHCGYYIIVREVSVEGACDGVMTFLCL